MKDTTITGRRKITELIWFGISFLAANILNLVAIIIYKSSAMELITSFFYVLIASAAIYVAIGVIRILIALIIKLFSHRRRR